MPVHIHGVLKINALLMSLCSKSIDFLTTAKKKSWLLFQLFNRKYVKLSIIFNDQRRAFPLNG